MIFLISFTAENPASFPESWYLLIKLTHGPANIICVSDDYIKSLNIENNPYFYLADGQVVNLKGYCPSGFYTKNDKTLEAQGAVGKIRINDVDCSMLYQTIDGKHKVTGFGYTADNKIIKLLDVNKILVENKMKIQNVTQKDLEGNLTLWQEVKFEEIELPNTSDEEKTCLEKFDPIEELLDF